jgi:hypothetical protein
VEGSLGGCLATDTFQTKPDGRGAEALPFCGGAHHEEAKAQEGQVGHRDINRDLVTQTDSHEDENPEGHKGATPMHPRYRRARPRMSPPRTGACAVCGRKAKRVCRRRRVVGASWEEESPEGRNPKSATCLKMAGRRREEEVAERLGKPVSDTEAGGVGTVSGPWATRGATGQPDGTWTLSTPSAEGE